MSKYTYTDLKSRQLYLCIGCEFISFEILCSYFTSCWFQNSCFIFNKRVSCLIQHSHLQDFDIIGKLIFFLNLYKRYMRFVNWFCFSFSCSSSFFKVSVFHKMFSTKLLPKWRQIIRKSIIFIWKIWKPKHHCVLKEFSQFAPNTAKLANDLDTEFQPYSLTLNNKQYFLLTNLSDWKDYNFCSFIDKISSSEQRSYNK